jgi:RNA binding exosome subunit
MKYIHNVTIRVFVKQGEDQEELSTGLKELSGLGSEIFEEKNPKKNVVIKQISATGFTDEKIKILELRLDKQKQCRCFLKHLLNCLSNEQKDLLKKQKRTRLDDNLHFFIRLEKQELVKGVYALTEKGECYHLRLSIAAFPSKHELALQVVDKLLKL